MNFFTAALVATAVGLGLLALVALRWKRRIDSLANASQLSAPGAVAPGISTHDGPFPDTACPVCSAPARRLADLDFNRSCEDVRGAVFPSAEIAVEYQRCSQCGFIFAPMFLTWSKSDFETWIYNEDYPLTDPGYLIDRPTVAANAIETVFSEKKNVVRHLDYGGGNGEMSRILKQRGWNSVSYDPLADADMDTASLGQFDIITAIEVIEHVPHPHQFMQEVMQFLRQDGVILVSTVLSDDQFSPDGLGWWYASPRNGHISLYSQNSLKTLANHHGFELRYYEGLKLFNRTPPSWAREMFPSQ